MVTPGTVEHKPPMASMSDTFKLEDALLAVTREPYKSNPYIVEPKWDGISASFVYKDGKLVRGLTRGDGLKGNHIFNCDEILHLPLEIPTLNDVTVRGELVINTSWFDYEKYSNTRNTVAGAIRKGGKGHVKALRIEFIPWDVIFTAIAKHSDKGLWLSSNGFTVKNSYSTDIKEFYEHLSKQRLEIQYDMDGVVIKINDKKVATQLGMGSKYSNSMFALKFKDDNYIGEVIGMSWQMGMFGVYTPVAKINPVEVNGVSITSVTLHNLEQVTKAECGIGSLISFIRSGDVIPKYINTIRASGRTNRPKFCVHCESPLEIVTSKANKKDPISNLYCLNRFCTEKTRLKLKHFTKRGYLDIKGLSKESIDKLYLKGYLRDYVDLFTITEERLTEVLGKNGKKIYNRIQNVKGLPLELLLGSLAIPNGGRSVFKLIDHTMTYEEMIKVRGIGPETAKSVIEFIKDNKSMIDELIRVAKPTIDKTPTPTVTYGISGSIEGGRPALIKKLAKIGWVKTSGKADYFIAGDNAVMNKAKGTVIKVTDIPW